MTSCDGISQLYIFVTHTIAAHSLLFLLLLIVLLGILLPNKKKINKTHPSESSSSSSSSSLHAIITGGSSGIGLSIAHDCAARRKQSDDTAPLFSHITLIARNRTNLQTAKDSLLSSALTSPDTKITILPADVTDWDSISTAISTHLSSTPSKPPILLFNVAGTALARPFLSTPLPTFSHLMTLNYLGSVYATRAALPYMPPGSNITFTSSAAGQVGIYGYAAYSPTKFALRGFAECLKMEVEECLGVGVQLAFPPDTDTPGYEKENEGKPLETRLISEEGGLKMPGEVAEKMVSEAINQKRFLIYFCLDTWMLSTLTAGMSEVHNLFDAICQICLMSLLRLVSLFYLKSWRDIVKKCHIERVGKEGKKSNDDEGLMMMETTTNGKKDK